MKKIILIVLVLLFLFPMHLFATTNSGNNLKIEVDLSKVSPTAAQEIIRLQKSESEGASVIQALNDETTVNKYSAIGKAIASTLKDVLQTINSETNSFAKTPVGITAVSLLIYEIAGKDIIRGIILMMLVLSLYIVVLTSFKYFHTNKKTPVELTKDIITDGKPNKTIKKTFEYIPRYSFSSDEARIASAVAHVVAFVVITVVTVVNM